MSPDVEWDVGFSMEDEEVFISIPAGQYIARCDNIEKKESKSGGFSNLYWKMVITEGQYANRSTQGLTHLKPDAPHIGFLRACSVLRPDLSMKGKKFKPADFIGRKCVIVMKDNTYTDNKTGEERTNTRLDDWMPLPESPGVDADKSADAPVETDAEFEA